MGISFFINTWISITKEKRINILQELQNTNQEKHTTYSYILNSLYSYEQQFQHKDDKIYLFYLLELYPSMSIIFEILIDEISNINNNLSSNKNDLEIYNL
jgi:hypothetical protein